MKVSDITYATGNFTSKYVQGLGRATSLPALKQHLEAWKEIAGDAYEIVQTWDVATFQEFRKALQKERYGGFAGEEAAKKFGKVMMPEALVLVQIAVQRFCCMESVALIRLMEEGILRLEGGRLRWKESG